MQRYAGVWLHKETIRFSGGALLHIPFASGTVPPPEMVHAVVTEAQSYATRLVISVEDSLFTMLGDVPGWSLALALDGSERSFVQDSTGFEFSVSLTWVGGTPAVHRSFGVRRAIVDALEVTGDSVLVVTRSVRWGPDHSRGDLRYVYVRNGSPPPLKLRVRETEPGEGELIGELAGGPVRR